MPAKFNLLIAASIPAVALVPLLACGGGSSGKTDAPVIVTHDSPGSGGSGSAMCTFPSTFNATTTASGTRYTAAGSGTNPIPENKLDFDALVGGTIGSDNEQVLRVLIFGGCGATGTGCTGGSAANADPDWPQIFTQKSGLDLAATGSDGNLLHPDVLLVLLGDPGTTSYNTVYFAVAGVVNVTAAANGSGHTFSGNGSGLDFIHVDLSTNMEAADGCESIVPTFSWSGSAQFAGKQFAGREITPEMMNVLRRRTR